MKSWVVDYDDNLIVDDVFCLEEISKANSVHWRKLKQKLNVHSSIKFPHVMRSVHQDYKTYFDKSRYKKAIELCQEDIDFFEVYLYD